MIWICNACGTQTTVAVFVRDDETRDSVTGNPMYRVMCEDCHYVHENISRALHEYWDKQRQPPHRGGK